MKKRISRRKLKKIPVVGAVVDLVLWYHDIVEYEDEVRYSQFYNLNNGGELYENLKKKNRFVK